MPFLKIDTAGRVFIFTQQKTDAGTSKLEQYFFLNLYFDGYFTQYYSSQAINLDGKRLSSPVNKTYAVGTRNRPKKLLRY